MIDKKQTMEKLNLIFHRLQYEDLEGAEEMSAELQRDITRLFVEFHIRRKEMRTTAGADHGHYYRF